MTKKNRLKKSNTNKVYQTEQEKIKGLPGINRHPSLINRTFNIIRNILAVVGLVFTLWWGFAPNILVSPISWLNEYNPGYIPFIIQNNNYFFSIYQVEIECRIKELRTTSGSLTVASDNYNVIFKELKQIDAIGPLGQATEKLPLTRVKTFDRLDNGDIAIVVKFLPNLIYPWPIERKFRFVVFTDPNGNKFWTPQPMKK